MQIGTAKIDFEGLFIEGPAGRHSIEPKVMNLLGVLVENAQNVVTREDLITAVWGVEYGGDERLSRAISVLRKAFGDVRGRHTHIETISKRGYRLIAAVGHMDAKWGDAPLNSIAVLPFTNMNKDIKEDFFAVGLTDEIINTLARVPALKVTGRTSSFAFIGQNLNVQDIAKKLNVAHVLEGTVHKDSERVRIHVQLINAKDGYHLWAQKFDEVISDMFYVQEKIAKAIISALPLVIGCEDDAPVSDLPTANNRAYELFLQARDMGRRLTGQSNLRVSVDLFEQAIALDPDFSEAMGWLACFSAILPEFVNTPNWNSYFERAREAAEQSLIIDPDCSAAWFALGVISSRELKMHESLSSFLKASALDPNDPGSSFGVALGYAAIGLHEPALRIAKEAIAKDPLRAVWHGVLAGLEMMVGNKAAAETSIRRCFDLGYGSAAFRISLFIKERSGSKAAIRFMQQSYKALEPGEQEELRSPLARWLVFNAFFGRNKIAKSIVSRRLKKRIMDPTVQPTLANAMSFYYMNDPEYFMRTILHQTPAYAVYLFAICFERSERGRRIRAHPDFPIFAEKTGLVRAWQKYGWPDVVQPQSGTDSSNLQFTCH